MQQVIRKPNKKFFALATLTLAAFSAALFASEPLAAQQTGPLPPPPTYSAPTPLPQPGAAPATAWSRPSKVTFLTPACRINASPWPPSGRIWSS